MITGMGTDIVENGRFKKWLETPELISRYFHPDEIAAWTEAGAKNSGRWIQYFAVRFAAKEAFGKALGTGLSGFSLKNVCIVHDISGKPSYRLYDDALTAFQKSGAVRLHVSLSHETAYSVAVTILEN